MTRQPEVAGRPSCRVTPKSPKRHAPAWLIVGDPDMICSDRIGSSLRVLKLQSGQNTWITCGHETVMCRSEPTDRLAVYCVEDMEMQLNEREASLVDAFRRLPPDAATELSALAERLAELAPNHRIDWSDSWSDEDLNDFRAASLRRLDAEESEDRD
jgi:hypothetical protein